MATKELTGGSSDYYKIHVANPTSGGDPYTAECNDIIESLGMNFAEGNILKALWRIAKARMGEGKPGVPPLYDETKVDYFAQRVLARAEWAEERKRAKALKGTVDGGGCDL